MTSIFKIGELTEMKMPYDNGSRDGNDAVIIQ